MAAGAQAAIGSQEHDRRNAVSGPKERDGSDTMAKIVPWHLHTSGGCQARSLGSVLAGARVLNVRGILRVLSRSARTSWTSIPKTNVCASAGSVIGRTMREFMGTHLSRRKILKVIRDPRLAAALLNAQVQLRGRARVPLSVRLRGKVHIAARGEVVFGEGITLFGNVVPIEFVSRIQVGDHTFINYGSSISAHKLVNIGRDCLLGHHTFKTPCSTTPAAGSSTWSWRGPSIAWVDP
jgi:hypothetical protein